MARVWLIVVVAVVCGWPVMAAAQPLAERAVVAFERADYSEAARAVKQSLAQESLDAPALERLYVVYATSLLAVGDDEAARGAFATLLAIQPAFRPDADSSPKLLDVFRRAAADAPLGGPRIEALPATVRGATVRLEASVSASARLAAVVEFRSDDAVRARRAMSCARMAPSQRCALEIEWRSARLEYRFGLTTPEGALVLTTPTETVTRSAIEHAAPPASAPAIAAAPRVERRRVSPHVWIWPVAGILTVGLAVGLVFALTATPSSGAELGRVHPMLEAAP